MIFSLLAGFHDPVWFRCALLQKTYRCHSAQPDDARALVYDIISQYCFSQAEIAEISTYSESIQEMWLQSFMNSQSVMVKSKVLQSAKEHIHTFSPTLVAFPDRQRPGGLTRVWREYP